MKKTYQIILFFLFIAPIHGMFTSKINQLRTMSPMRNAQTSRTSMLRSWLNNKYNTLNNYLRRSSSTSATQAGRIHHISSEEQNPVITPTPSTIPLVAERKPTETTNTLHANLEKIKVLLEMGKPDMIAIFNILSQIPANTDSLELDTYKQKFFDNINFNNATFIQFLKKHSPKELYILLPNNVEMFTVGIEGIYRQATPSIDFRTVLRLFPPGYEQALYEIISNRPIDDLTYIILHLMDTHYGKNLLRKWLEWELNNSPSGDSPQFRKFMDILKQHKAIFIRSTVGVKLIEDFTSPRYFLENAFGINSTDTQTPSARHLKKNRHLLSLLGPARYIIYNENFQSNMIRKPIHKEKELIDLGYVVMYHGRRFQYGFLSDIYSMLYSYKSGKNLKDFIFTHLDDPVLGNVSDAFYASETKKRERLIKEGNTQDSKVSPIGIANRASLLFLNKFLFGNLTRLGSCSMDYILINRNIGEIHFSLQELFSMFGKSDAYKKFESELTTLQKEYNNLTEYGELLQIAIPEKNIDKCVYHTTSGGPKKPFAIIKKDKNGRDFIESYTIDIKSILKNLDNNPEDKCEFVLVNTRDKFGGLNPDSGIKMFSYNAVDPKIWAEFQQKMHALFSRITKFMEQHDMQNKQAQMARE